MITSVEIQGLRGIREGRLDDLPKLAILVGPNGSGKSTVLDALFIAANSSPRDAIVRSTLRRGGLPRGARWLWWRGGHGHHCLVGVTGESGVTRRLKLTLSEKQRVDKVVAAIEKGGSFRPIQDVDFALDREDPADLLTIAGAADLGVFEPFEDGEDPRLTDGRLLAHRTPVHELYSAAVQQGRASTALEILRDVLPDLQRIEILTERNIPVLHLVFGDHSVPVAVAGDGVHMLLRLVLELASRKGGVALLEEPELHQHPAAMRQSARAILAAVRRDLQVILTTHSLELIDALLDTATDDELESVALYRVSLADGVLLSAGIPGSEAAFARTQIQDDLR